MIDEEYDALYDINDRQKHDDKVKELEAERKSTVECMINITKACNRIKNNLKTTNQVVSEANNLSESMSHLWR